MKQRILYFTILIIWLCSGCLEYFTPNIKNHDKRTVIEALLTDDDETTYIKISRTYHLDSSKGTPVFATAYLEDPEYERTYFVPVDNEPGKQKITPGFEPVIGETYVLHVIVSDNESYTSSPVTLIEAPAIDSIYYEIKSRINSDNRKEDYVQIYLDTHDASNKTQYYRWDWSDVYEIRTPKTSFYIYENNEIRERTEDEMINRCWNYDENHSILISSTEDLSEDIISHQPLVKILPTSIKTNVLYCLDVKQYALKEESYKYYSLLKQVSENAGTLFDREPTQVTGNIKRDQDSTEPVLGIFEATTISIQRVFYTPQSIKEINFNNSLFGYCHDPIIHEMDLRMYTYNGYKIQFLSGHPNDPYSRYEIIMASKECSDCRLYGTTKKPDFWPN